jgi:gamma-glutamylcyclotransferase (GGCT)/AIG2-like uncharacterized protein YtfP
MRLFVYGTLLDKVVRLNVIGRQIQGVDDVLMGYRKINRKFSDGMYPDLIHDDESEVEGKVLEISDDELEQCDKYEGKEYCRSIIVLRSGIQANVYKGK